MMPEGLTVGHLMERLVGLPLDLPVGFRFELKPCPCGLSMFVTLNHGRTLWLEVEGERER